MEWGRVGHALRCRKGSQNRRISIAPCRAALPAELGEGARGGVEMRKISGFCSNFGIPLLVPYTKDFERITQF